LAEDLRLRDAAFLLVAVFFFVVFRFLATMTR